MRVALKDLEAPARIVPSRPMTDAEYADFCAKNPDLRIERTSTGDIVVMPPTGGESSYRNSSLTAQLHVWARRDGRGKTFDSNAEFILPSGAARAPDASWVSREQLARLTREEKRGFPPLCPEFVVELMSPSDRLEDVLAKMDEYLASGATLGWVLDPDGRIAYVCRPGRPTERLVAPAELRGEGPVEGFVLELAEIWDPDL